MKIFVINFRKYKGFFRVLRTTALMLLVLALGGGVGGVLINSQRYVSAISMQDTSNVFIIDAGHGGEDPGAVGVNGVYEKNLNMDIALQVGELLTERGYAVIYTRTEDKLLYTEEENIRGLRKISDLKNRCKIAAEYPNATFISIHMNSFGSPKYSGLQVYYSENNEESRLLADKVQRSVKNELQNENNRVIKNGHGMFVLENIENPAILIECGFLTNENECEKLSEKEYQKELSLSIVCGIIEYKESK